MKNALKTPGKTGTVKDQDHRKALPILSIDTLNVHFDLRGGRLLAVRDLSFSLGEGRTMGLVGESGCGKSVTAHSVLRLIRPPGVIASGRIEYDGRDVLALPEEDMTAIRGREIAMIFQEPMTSLNPVLTVGYQIAEPLRIHLGMSDTQARERAVDLLESVGIGDPARRYAAYPHELSGGMRQRVMIAMSLSTSPSVLIADEPTTALDVTIQAQILDLLLGLQRERRMSLLLITHDLGVVANIADDVAIMYAGEIVESGAVKRLFESPLHPYTIGLFEAIPRIGKRVRRLATIPGMVPTFSEQPRGCAFHPRCYNAADECLRAPIPLVQRKGHAVRCIRV
ncbi:MAG TPA: ABC transporter ATP-binding protein [Spirochaetota bacterium]|nr:ABC transporter ATP-binding protein [Spirochaetota bacterium]